MSTITGEKLFTLYKLHKIDVALAEIRGRAASLDPGRELQAKIKQLESVFEERKLAADRLSGEQLDLELRQKSNTEKIKKLDRELYGGQVVSPREVEVMQKEIQNLKAQNSGIDDRLLELMELFPPAQEIAEAAQKELEAAKAQLAQHQKRVLQIKNQLEVDFKNFTLRRAEMVKPVDPGLLKQYDLIRARAGGIGMSEITDKGLCERCGTAVPEKVVQSAKENRLVTCESCHRILFRVMPEA